MERYVKFKYGTIACLHSDCMLDLVYSCPFCELIFTCTLLFSLAHRATEDYVALVGNIMYPGTYMGPFGYSHEQGQYPVERPCMLGLLQSPLRHPTVIERWSPYEIASFEAAMTLYGKEFHAVQKVVKTKTTKEIVEFYYIWKKTSHYKRWKEQFEHEVESEDEEIMDLRPGKKSKG